MEALLSRFRAAHTQVLGVSVDSVYCHANWGRDLGGISFPLLADFQPKGGVGKILGLYLDKDGIDDRATVIVDSAGTIRHASTVTPSGMRNIASLVGMCENIDRESSGKVEEIAAPGGLPPGSSLFVKSHCGFSRAVLIARDNLHLKDELPVKTVTQDSQARDELKKVSGKDQAPCLILEGKPVLESKEIIRRLVNATTDLPA